MSQHYIENLELTKIYKYFDRIENPNIVYDDFLGFVKDFGIKLIKTGGF